MIINENEILLYTTPDGDVRIDVLYRDENIWLTQKRMAELFDVNIRTISEHLQNIFASQELDKDSVIRIFRNTAEDGKQYPTQFYNLDAIIAIGYRVNSKKATSFRVWATKILRDFIIKGFALDSERLKNGPKFGKDYFNELLEKIREIRASERRFYQKITDIYAECSADYDPNSDITRQFYAKVQNKLYWAIYVLTAAELIYSRVDHKKPHMGLTTWKDGSGNKIHKSDVSIAKNYLTEKELSELNHIVSMYLDYAELQARKNRLMKMQDWVEKLDAFLLFNDYEVLKDAGKVSTEVAKALAEGEYEKYRIVQDKLHESDFDELIKASKESEKITTTKTSL
ncbi:virulence RhuM family protein [Wolbachia endosymbiont of Oedothorax gibbosus]|uniref:virulence RhuM family protein n=1 Tax=Wolbachia endosymbiont of Oedothorax gibbosus TaxID=931100 RepID=UPI0020249A91|nr:virulence RhuM family protein [Wolbachia endosymbiont of Oedothorax gibbosus]